MHSICTLIAQHAVWKLSRILIGASVACLSFLLKIVLLILYTFKNCWKQKTEFEILCWLTVNKIMPFIAIGRYKTLSAMKVHVTLSDCTKAPLRESCRFVDFEIFQVFSPKLQNIKLWYKLNTSLSGDVPQQRFSENKSFNLIQEECRSLPLQEFWWEYVNISYQLNFGLKFSYQLKSGQISVIS